MSKTQCWASGASLFPLFWLKTPAIDVNISTQPSCKALHLLSYLSDPKDPVQGPPLMLMNKDSN